MSELAGVKAPRRRAGDTGSGRHSVTALAAAIWPCRPASRSDLEYISLRVLVIALVITLIGIFVLKRFAARSIGLMITIVVAATVITCSPAWASSPTAWLVRRASVTTCWT